MLETSSSRAGCSWPLSRSAARLGISIYFGVRVRVVASLATARIAAHIDVNFGDPIWPGPMEAELPLLLGGVLRLPGYPDHMVLAEKIVTAAERGDQNTRWRDFVDIAAITSARRIRATDLRQALETVADSRRFELGPLSALLSDMPDMVQARWEVWRRRQQLESSTPVGFSDLLQTCLNFAEPVLSGQAVDLVWDPEIRRWV